MPYWTHADRTTVLYVPHGYSRSEKLALEYLRRINVHVEAISSVSALTTYLNTRTIDGEKYDILRLLFICHGLPGKFALNYSGSPRVDLTTRNMSRINASSFCQHARIYSYACRTGVWRAAESFNALADAEPENSLAPRMATHLGVPFHAFYVRTLFAECIRDPADSAAIATACRTGRVGNEGSILNLSDEHEALPHPGQGTSGALNPFNSGQENEGTSEYSLWRKQGGRQMPVAASSPAGLPAVFAEFTP